MSVERGWHHLPRPDNGSMAPPPPNRWSITGAALGLPGTERIFDDAQRRPHPRRAISSSTSSPRASAAPCSTSTSPAWSRARTARPRFETHRQHGGCHQAGRPRRRLRPGAGIRRSDRSPAPRSIASPAWPWAPASTRCATPASRWSCTTRPPARHAVAGPLGAARLDARRYRRHLRLGLPWLRLLRRTK